MASRSLNKVLLIGNLTRDPELRYTPQGTAVCTFGLATNRSWKNSDGDRQEDVEFYRIVAWQKLAEICSQLLFKGRKVYVEGRLQTRQWEGKDGQERQTTEVVIDNMIVLDYREKNETEEVKPAVKSEKKSEGKPIQDKKEPEKKDSQPDEKEDKSSNSEDKSEKVSPDDIPF